MADLADVAPAFVEVAHRSVWATVATVDAEGRPRTRVLHPISPVIPASESPDSAAFVALGLEPWRVPVLRAPGDLLRWRA